VLIGLLSDAHGNPLGLRTCLDALRRAGAERIYFLGDAVGYLPGEGAVLDTLTAAGIVCLRGNHEAMLLGDLDLDPVRDQAYQLGAARTRMTAEHLQLVKSWPDTRQVELAGARLLMVHGSPRDHLRDYVYPDSDLDWFADLGYDAVFMGNTHRPFVASRGGVLVVNVGSCGLPRDQGDLPACALYDSRARTCTILRVAVPAEAVAAQFDQPLHPLIDECLRRRADDLVGTVVATA
jgi:predicted phosphodiesterase